MNENWKFSDIPYTRPDTAALQSRFDELTRRAKNAGSADELLSVVRELDALRQEIFLCDSLVTIRAFHDVTDEFYQTEFAEPLPRLETLASQSLRHTVPGSLSFCVLTIGSAPRARSCKPRYPACRLAISSSPHPQSTAFRAKRSAAASFVQR